MTTMTQKVKVAVLTGATAALAAVPLVAYAQKAGWVDTPAAEVKWNDSGLGFQFATVKGNTLQTEHVTLLKFPAGATIALHTHKFSYVGVVVAGKMRHFLKGQEKAARPLGAGSFWAMPGGAEHVSECLAGSECIAAVTQEGGFDLNLIK